MMTPPDLSRLFNPRTVAVIGGGAWGAAVIDTLRRTGFTGDIWPVHPAKSEVAGLQAYTGVPDLPGVPDAAFVGINRDASIGAVERLARAGAGGAICFASGFAEVADGAEAHQRLLTAAGDMPILGPNCYGFVNALDSAALWPDQHGMKAVDRGVAILTQSSNLALNLTMQTRGLPIGVLATCGNQAKVSQASIAAYLLADPRITAIGCHVEGFGNPADWQELARKARAAGKPIVVMKSGRSDAARQAAISHTASLAGADAGAQALLDRFGMSRVDDPETFIETLKVMHLHGSLPSDRIATMSCSGGEAALAADLAQELGLTLPPLNPRQHDDLAAALGPKVALANPLDYHTYIWRDAPAMAETYAAMTDPDLALNVLIADFPRADRCDPKDWDCVILAIRQAARTARCPLAICASLPDTMPEPLAEELLAEGILPLCGLRAGLAALASAVDLPALDLNLDVARVGDGSGDVILSEHDAKAALASYGLNVPASVRTTDPGSAALPYPVALKSEGLTHKTEAGGVFLGLTDPDAVTTAAKTMLGDRFLVEEMITGGVAELLIGVRADPAHGYVLSVGAGGQWTELWQDVQNLLVPASRVAIHSALQKLRIAPLLAGYRGSPPADLEQIVDAIEAVQAYVMAHAPAVAEVEVNPLICTADRAVAVDALIRTSE